MATLSDQENVVTVTDDPPKENQLVTNPLNSYNIVGKDRKCILRGIVASVQVRTEDGSIASQGIEKKLMDLGAQVRKTVSRECTHLIYNKAGSRLQYDRAARMPHIKIVNVLWLEQCIQEQMHVDEEPFNYRKLVKNDSTTFLFPSLALGSAKKSMEPKVLRPSDINNRRRTIGGVLEKVDPNQCHKVTPIAGIKRKADPFSCPPPSAKNIRIVSSPVMLAGSGAAVDHTGIQLTPLPLTKRKPEKRRHLVFTGFSKKDREHLENLVVLLGGFKVVEKVDERTTHIVCGSERRTMNLMLAIVHKCWVLVKDWIDDSVKSNLWMDESKFVAPWLPQTLLDRESTAKLPLTTVKLYIEKSLTLYSDIEKLATLSGATIVPKNMANIIIADHTSISSVFKRSAISDKILMRVNQKWLFDSIMSCTQLPLKEYLENIEESSSSCRNKRLTLP